MIETRIELRKEGDELMDKYNVYEAKKFGAKNIKEYIGILTREM